MMAKHQSTCTIVSLDSFCTRLFFGLIILATDKNGGGRMGNFVRDLQIKNVSLDLRRVDELCEVVESLFLELNDAAGYPPSPYQLPIFTYIIRHDGQGDRVYSRSDLMDRFSRANIVEKLIITLETMESTKTNRKDGVCIEMVFDNSNPNCFLTVSADSSRLCGAAFGMLSNLLRKYRTRYGVVRSTVFQIMIQLTGVTLFFILSISLGKRFGGYVASPNGFILVVAFTLLMCSNVWSFLLPVLQRGLSAVFPSIEFISEGRQFWHWTVQAVVGAVISGMVLYAVGSAGEVLLRMAAGIFEVAK